jgi:hypothetical protein
MELMIRKIDKNLDLYYVLISILSFATVVMMAGTQLIGWQFWNFYLGLPEQLPPFTDLHSPLSAIECSNKEVNVYTENPCDPHNRPFNYPPTWLVPPVKYILQLSIGVLGWVLVFIYVFSISLLQRVFNKLSTFLLLLFFFVSPPSMFLIERGNVDMIIYSLVVFGSYFYSSTSYRKSIFSDILFVISVFLKLFTLPALITNGLLRREYRNIISIAISILFLFFVLLNYPNIFSNTGFGISWSYGSTVAPKRFLLLMGDRYQYLSARSLGLILSILIIIFSLLMTVVIKHSSNSTILNVFEYKQNIRSHLYVSGSSIFIGTFIIGSNWDYRLVFLSCVIPYLAHKTRNYTSTLPSLGIALITLLLYTPFLPGIAGPLDIINELFDWALFSYFSISLMSIMFDEFGTDTFQHLFKQYNKYKVNIL